MTPIRFGPPNVTQIRSSFVDHHDHLCESFRVVTGINAGNWGDHSGEEVARRAFYQPIEQIAAVWIPQGACLVCTLCELHYSVALVTLDKLTWKLHL